MRTTFPWWAITLILLFANTGWTFNGYGPHWFFWGIITGVSATLWVVSNIYRNRRP